MSEYTVDQLMTAYVGLRDRKDAYMKEANAWKKEVEAQMELIEMHLFETCNALGVDSVKSGNNIAFKASKDYLNISDRQEFTEFIVKSMLTSIGIVEGFDELVPQVLNSGALDYTTIKAKKDNCKEYMREHDVAPPGTTYTQETVIQVRKN